MEKRDRNIILIIRFFHILITILFLLSIIYLYYAALTKRFSYLLFLPLLLLIIEAIFLIYNNGNCPLKNIHERYGDEKGFWDLFLPKKFIPYVVKTLEIITVIGFIFLILSFFGIA